MRVQRRTLTPNRVGEIGSFFAKTHTHTHKHAHTHTRTLAARSPQLNKNTYQALVRRMHRVIGFMIVIVPNRPNALLFHAIPAKTLLPFTPTSRGVRRGFDIDFHHIVALRRTVAFDTTVFPTPSTVTSITATIIAARPTSILPIAFPVTYTTCTPSFHSKVTSRIATNYCAGREDGNGGVFFFGSSVRFFRIPPHGCVSCCFTNNYCYLKYVYTSESFA